MEKQNARPPDNAKERSFLIQVSRRVMACEFQVLLNADQYSRGPDLAIDALNLTELLESQLSIYRNDSEISQLNQSAFNNFINVDSSLFALLQLAITISAETGGAFDIATGALTNVWGFRDRGGRFPHDQEILNVLPHVGFHHLILENNPCRVRFDRQHLQLNLGSIGKGYALDRGANVLREEDINDFLFHGGHSSILAIGSRATSTHPQEGWRVSLNHPLRNDIRLGEIVLRNQGLGTAGSGNQFFHHRGRRYGHILDPRTGRPTEGLLSVTVIAPNATLADALATAFFVMGIEAASDYCASRNELAAIFVFPDQRAQTTRIETINLNETQWYPV